MMMQSFALSGKHITVNAYVKDTPVFDLDFHGETIAEEMEYTELMQLCQELCEELKDVSAGWMDAGRNVQGFDQTWREQKEAKTNDQPQTSEIGGESA